jgi:hypothetical protein
MRTEAYKLFGVDLTQIPGLMMLVFMLFSEVGRDMSRWPTQFRFPDGHHLAGFHPDRLHRPHRRDNSLVNSTGQLTC